MICLVKVLFYELWNGKRSLKCEDCPMKQTCNNKAENVQ